MNAENLERSIWSRARWLVIAPHPDDETIGAAGLIAHVAAEGRLGGIVYLTDGTGSHPDGTPRIAGVRRREAHAAIRRLTGQPVPIDWIGWKDAHPCARTTPRFERDARRLGALIRRRCVDAIAVTGPEESHCDHVAAFRLAEHAADHARRAVALFSYHVWSMMPDRARCVRTRAIRPGRRRQALRAHRSQLTPAYGEGFRLPPERQRMATTDVLVLRGPAR